MSCSVDFPLLQLGGLEEGPAFFPASHLSRKRAPALGWPALRGTVRSLSLVTLAQRLASLPRRPGTVG